MERQVETTGNYVGWNIYRFAGSACPRIELHSAACQLVLNPSESERSHSPLCSHTDNGTGQSDICGVATKPK